MRSHFDVAIIGAGIGGLMCGNFLVQKGVKTVIFEQHHTPGGCMSGFTRNDFTFDSGDQSFESAWTVFPLLKELKILDKVKFIKADYRIVLPDAEIVLDSFEGIRGQLKKIFPHESPGINSYFEEVERVSGYIESFFPDRETNPFLQGGWKMAGAVIRFLLNGSLLKVGQLKRYREMLSRKMLEIHFTDMKLINALDNLGYKNWSALDYIITWYCWLYDYWYPKGGIQAFSCLLANTFEETGGMLMYGSVVEKILFEKNKATGVKTLTGEEYKAKFVVSSSDYRQTLLKLLDTDVMSEEDKKELLQSEVSETFVSVYLALNCPAHTLKKHMKTHHVWIIPSYNKIDFSAYDDFRFHQKTWLELSSPSIGDENLAPGGKSSLIIQAISLYDWMHRWRTGQEEAITPEHDKLKERVAHEMITIAEKIIPWLSNRIIFKEIATPITIAHYTRNTKAATCGWTWDPRRSYARKGLKKWGGNYRTPVSNLYAASQWSVHGGCIPRCALAGKKVANMIISRL